jgi:hypothetical protein
MQERLMFKLPLIGAEEALVLYKEILEAESDILNGRHEEPTLDDISGEPLRIVEATRDNGFQVYDVNGSNPQVYLVGASDFKGHESKFDAAGFLKKLALTGMLETRTVYESGREGDITDTLIPGQDYDKSLDVPSARRAISRKGVDNMTYAEKQEEGLREARQRIGSENDDEIIAGQAYAHQAMVGLVGRNLNAFRPAIQEAVAEKKEVIMFLPIENVVSGHLGELLDTKRIGHMSFVGTYDRD